MSTPSMTMKLAGAEMFYESCCCCAGGSTAALHKAAYEHGFTPEVAQIQSIYQKIVGKPLSPD